MFANFFFSGSSTSAGVSGITLTPIVDGRAYDLDPGQSYATVSLTGTYTGGDPSGVEAKVFNKNDDTTVVDWTDLSATITHGGWSGDIQIPGETFQMYVAVRASNDHAVSDTGTTYFRVGYVLSNYLILVRPAIDAAAGRLWQNAGKTVPAVIAGDPVVVATLPAGITSGVDLAETGAAQLALDDLDGFSSLVTLNPVGGSLTNSSVLSPVQTGSTHWGAWVWLSSSESFGVAGLLQTYFNGSLGVTNARDAGFSYGAGGVSVGSQFSNNSWQLVQGFFDAVHNQSGLKVNDGAVGRAATSAVTLASNFHFIGTFANTGVNFGTFFIRNANPTDEEMHAAYLAGPAGDGSDWPPPILSSAAVMFSGGTVQLDFLASFTLGTGSPTVTIDGVPVTCTRYYQPASTTLMIRIPSGSFVPDSLSTVTITLPFGLVSLGEIVDAPVTNNTGVENFPIVPDAGASTLKIGVNSYQPSYFSPDIPFADGMKLASDWIAGGGTATYDANGFPATLTGGVGYVYANFLSGLAISVPTGNYLLLSQGAGSASLYGANTGLPYTVTATGTAGGYSYQVVNIPSSTGIQVRAVPPWNGKVIFPGAWDTGSHLQTTDYLPQWVAAYQDITSFRLMDYLTTNNSNVRDVGDLIPAGFYTQGYRATRYNTTGSVTGTSVSSSTFLGTPFAGNLVYLVTHNAPGDPFKTGDFVQTGPGSWLVERISSTQYKTFGSSAAPPTGAVQVVVATSGSLEDSCGLVNSLGQDLWVNIPHLASDALVTSMATRILAALTSGRKCRVEYSNEVWNFGFIQFQYNYGVAAVAGISYAAAYARRSAQVHKLFLDAFTTAGRSADLIRVVAWQAGVGSGTDVLDAYKAWCVSVPYSFTAPHEYAVAPYFGDNINPGVGSDTVSTGFRDYLMNGSNSVDPLTAAQILDVVGWGLTNLTSLGVTFSGALVDAWNTANSATVKKTCYEAGQSLFGAQSSISGCTSGDGPNYAGSSGLNGDGLIWEGALERANRHPRMTNLMYGSMKQCLDAGYTFYGEFTCDGTYTMFGYWGCREFFGQVVGPGNGTGGSFDNRTDLNSIALCEAVKLYAMQQWALA